MSEWFQNIIKCIAVVLVTCFVLICAYTTYLLIGDKALLLEFWSYFKYFLAGFATYHVVVELFKGIKEVFKEKKI